MVVMHSLEYARKDGDDLASYKAIQIEEAVEQQAKVVLKISLLLAWLILVFRIGDILDQIADDFDDRVSHMVGLQDLVSG